MRRRDVHARAACAARGERVGGEVEVLEDREDAQVVDDRHEQQRLARARPLRLAERAADAEVDRAADEDDAEAEDRSSRSAPSGTALLARGVAASRRSRSRSSRRRGRARAAARCAAASQKTANVTSEEDAVEGRVEEQSGREPSRLDSRARNVNTVHMATDGWATRDLLLDVAASSSWSRAARAIFRCARSRGARACRRRPCTGISRARRRSSPRSAPSVSRSFARTCLPATSPRRRRARGSTHRATRTCVLRWKTRRIIERSS